MNKNTLEKIQDQIGYKFKNYELLEQAFTRRSYSQEEGGENNEVLEFIGDKVLDLITVKFLSEKYGSIDEYGEYQSDKSEQELTELKKALVQKKTLSDRIYFLDLEEYLIMGQGDIKNKVNHQEAVKEDLFEAILGAIAIDCNWNMEVIEDTVLQMLNPDEIIDSENDYISLIQNWSVKKYGVVPLFCVDKKSYMSSWYSAASPMLRPNYPINMTNYYDMKYCAQLKLGDYQYKFEAWGKSKSDARKNVCKFAYEHLDKESLLFTIQDEILNPNREQSINQLETLARRGYFSLPQYNFEQTYDEDGNPIWKCSCIIEEEEDYFSCIASTKKDAKKDAAYEMLMFVLEDDG